MPNSENNTTCPYLEISESEITDDVINEGGTHIIHRVFDEHKAPRCTAVYEFDENPNIKFPIIDFNRAVNICLQGKKCQQRDAKEARK